jgi:aminoglycoside 6'-N-acetyltransferase
MGSVDNSASASSPAVRPRLVGDRVTIRPGTAADVATLREILEEPSVRRWWHEPETPEQIAANLRGETDAVLLVIEVDGSVVGGIQYSEEADPDYRHAGIDIYLGSAAQGRGLGPEALGLLVRFLIDERKHHRVTIDPAATNDRAIRSYAAAGFRPVGVMRQYERGADGTFHDGLLMELLADDLA